jgi:hypothetical protein
MMTDAVVEVIEARRVIEIAQHLSTSLEVFAPTAELVELPLLPAAVIGCRTKKMHCSKLSPLDRRGHAAIAAQKPACQITPITL